VSTAAQNVDYKRELKHLYSAARTPALVDVPRLHYLMIQGSGGPYGAQYGAAVEALFSVAYAVKFAVRREQGVAFGVMPLESLWHTKDDTVPQETWDWTAMIMQPPPVTARTVEAARAAVIAKKGLAGAAELAYEELVEGTSAQVLHAGPYDAEKPTIDALHAFIGQRGLRPYGAHHEIYLNNPDRTAAERLKAVIRQPVR